MTNTHRTTNRIARDWQAAADRTDLADLTALAEGAAELLTEARRIVALNAEFWRGRATR